jgi:hypothetical protein
VPWHRADRVTRIGSCVARFTGELAAIPAELVEGPVGTRIAGHFTAQLEHARAAAVRELDGQRYLSLLDDLDVLLADPPLTPFVCGFLW